MPGSFVDEKLTERETDLLFEALAGATRIRLHLLLEHQSTAPALMAFRLLRYMVRIWEDEIAADPGRTTLTPIVPVVLHHSERGWTASTTFESLLELGDLSGSGIEGFLPRFRFVLDDISEQSDEAIALRLVSKVLRVTFAALREARRGRGDVLRLIQRLGRLLRDVRTSDRREAYARIIQYLFTVVAGDDPRPFLDAIDTEMGHEAKDEAMGLLDNLVERGRREGFAEGEVKGRRATLRKLLQLRFGALPAAVVVALDAMDLAALDAACERVLSAGRLEDVVAGS